MVAALLKRSVSVSQAVLMIAALILWSYRLWLPLVPGGAVHTGDHRVAEGELRGEELWPRPYDVDLSFGDARKVGYGIPVYDGELLIRRTSNWMMTDRVWPCDGVVMPSKDWLHLDLFGFQLSAYHQAMADEVDQKDISTLRIQLSRALIGMGISNAAWFGFLAATRANQTKRGFLVG